MDTEHISSEGNRLSATRWIILSCIGLPIAFALIHRSVRTTVLFNRGLVGNELISKLAIGVFYDLFHSLSVMAIVALPLILAMSWAFAHWAWPNSTPRKLALLVGGVLLWQVPAAFAIVAFFAEGSAMAVLGFAIVGMLAPFFWTELRQGRQAK